MPITLVTGLPGHGKTLYTLARFKDEAAKAEPVPRRVYYHGIKGLKIEGWEPWDVKDWELLPAGSLMVVDEAQFAFPVTGRGQTPEWVQKLATHRHLGLDFVVITQDPMLLDSFVRRLVDRHFHVIRKFGTHWATIHEFPNGARTDVAKNRKDSIKHEWRYPKNVFGLYESAEVHTVKTRIPARVYMLGLAVIAFGVFGYLAYKRLQPEAVSAASSGKTVDQVKAAGSGFAPGRTGEDRRRPMTPQEFAEGYTPRIAGLPHTAPAYDEVTKPSQAPYPAACLASKTKCQCYSQQATRLDTPERLCRDIAAGGFFVAWNLPAAQAVPMQQPQVAPQAQPVEHLAPVLIGQRPQQAQAAADLPAFEVPHPVVRLQTRPANPPGGFGQAVGPT